MITWTGTYMSQSPMVVSFALDDICCFTLLLIWVAGEGATPEASVSRGPAGEVPLSPVTLVTRPPKPQVRPAARVNKEALSQRINTRLSAAKASWLSATQQTKQAWNWISRSHRLTYKLWRFSMIFKTGCMAKVQNAFPPPNTSYARDVFSYLWLLICYPN